MKCQKHQDSHMVEVCADCYVNLVDSLRTELTQAREEEEKVRKIFRNRIKDLEDEIIEQSRNLEVAANINNNLLPRAEKAEARVKELNKELYLETVKNNSSAARVEFLDGKLERYREALEKACIGAKALYSYLDDIDTAGDLFKPEITPYFEAVQVYHKKRHVIATTDGYSINFPPEQALIDTEGES